jgi:hypothetical protein
LNFSGFAPGTFHELEALARSRDIGLGGVRLAHERGFLLFGSSEGHDVWGITDSSRRALEVRRLDCGVFANGKKCKALPGSLKHAIGISEAVPFLKVCIVEGAPDFLECHHHVEWEGKRDSVAVVTMLGAGLDFAPSEAATFKGKTVRLYPHADRDGIKAAERWHFQLRKAGARRVDLVDFRGKVRSDGEPVKDLLDFSLCHDPILERLIP